MRKIPNTFGLDVEAAVFLEYGSVEELEKLIADGRITSPYLHIGGGSNLLFTGNYEGVILHSRIGGVEVMAENEEKVLVRVGASVVWDDFVAYCTERGWYGTENLSLIPGEVGAAAVQNIGAYGVEVKGLISSVETVNIQGSRWPRKVRPHAHRSLRVATPRPTEWMSIRFHTTPRQTSSSRNGCVKPDITAPTTARHTTTPPRTTKAAGTNVREKPLTTARSVVKTSLSLPYIIR